MAGFRFFLPSPASIQRSSRRKPPPTLARPLPMFEPRRLLSFWGLACLASSVGAAVPGAVVEHFAKDNCVDCHDADMKKGGFDLTALPFDLQNPQAFGRWVQVFDRV